MPVRIQLSRRAGWRKPAGAVVVSRPTRWGNPHLLGEHDPMVNGPMSRERAAELYLSALRADLLPVSVDDVRRELRGKDLCCWCPAGAVCHADVLLKIANR